MKKITIIISILFLIFSCTSRRVQVKPQSLEKIDTTECFPSGQPIDIKNINIDPDTGLILAVQYSTFPRSVYKKYKDLIINKDTAELINQLDTATTFIILNMRDYLMSTDSTLKDSIF